ncbi:hypothetical protein [Pseudomonas sichuanensis]|uniref:hypothetical protein n=1 Tax=Pseudomonas TaxID=286 RepID=UPI0036E0CABC
MKVQGAVCLALTVLLPGCTNFTSPARSSQLESSTAYWFDYDASRRGAILAPDDVRIKVCSEPPPDVALSLVSKLETTLKKEGVGDAVAKSEFNSTVVKLAERTQMTMLLRESLYRLCEQSLRHDFTSAEFLAAYKETVQAAADLAKTDVAKAQAERDRSATVRMLVEQGMSAAQVQQYFTP